MESFETKARRLRSLRFPDIISQWSWFNSRIWNNNWSAEHRSFDNGCGSAEGSRYCIIGCPAQYTCWPLEKAVAKDQLLNIDKILRRSVWDPLSYTLVYKTEINYGELRDFLDSSRTQAITACKTLGAQLIAAQERLRESLAAAIAEASVSEMQKSTAADAWVSHKFGEVRNCRRLLQSSCPFKMWRLETNWH